MRVIVSRYIIIALVVALAFGAVYMRLYDMQVSAYDEYSAQAESKSSKTLTMTGKRGAIYDANMIPLAYDRETYNVQFYRDPSATSDADREGYTKSIQTVIELIESNGKKTIDGFWLEKGEDGKWRFNTGTENETVAKKREEQWRQNFYLTKEPEETLFDELCRKYFIPEDISEEMKIKILTIWQESRMYNYLSKPITIAYGVGFETVSEIEARSIELPGISIAKGYERVYPKASLASHIIGYVSKISGDQEMESYREKGYPYDALVGRTGIEASMEDQLTPHLEIKQGKQVVEINNRGKIIRELGYTAPIDGNNVILTIDTQLQAVMEGALAKNIQEIYEEQKKIVEDDLRWRKKNIDELTRYEKEGIELQLAQTGAAIAMDPNSGRILAMASWPNFDLSQFTGGIDPAIWNELIADPRNPMYNRAISARDTPGSIFKLVTALGGLAEGVITVDTRISDEGYFKGTDESRQPKCWIALDNIGRHANQTIVDGLAHSCNYFFYKVGIDLKSPNITKWGAALGLTSRTNVELPNESRSFVGNQMMLYDPSRAIADQATEKPKYAASVMKRALRAVGEDRNIKYDEDRLDRAVKSLMDIVVEEESKDQWPKRIREVLVSDMNIPSDYILSHFMVNDFVGYLRDLQWTSNETIMAAIGQSITQVTPIGVARYVSAIANGGTVYDAQIIDKIVSPTGEVVLDKQPIVANKIEGPDMDLYFSKIHEGMNRVTSVEGDGTAADRFIRAKYKPAAKTGTSQRTKIDIENNAWVVSYYPQEDPQIVVIVYVQNGYAGAKLADTVNDTITYFMEHQPQRESTTVTMPNTLGD